MTDEEKELLDDLPVGVIIVNPVRRIISSNPAAARLLGVDNIPEGSVCHKSIFRSTEPCLECPFEADGRDPLVRELELPERNCFLEVNAILRRDGNILETMTDISIYKGFQKELAEKAMTDPTSGVLRRRFLREHIQREIHRARRLGGDLSVVMLRVSDIEMPNIESVPRTIARILRGVGEILGQETRAYDLAYRFGHDTFAIILPGEDLAGGLRAAKRLYARIKELGIEEARMGIAAMGNIAVADVLIHNAQRALFKADHSEDPVATAS